MKYGDAEIAHRYSMVWNYPEINQRAVLEMYRQVGDLRVDDNGIAQRGLLVRHLVLPNDLASSQIILRFLAEKVSKNVYLNIMAQYHPVHHALEYHELRRRITPQEYQRVINLAKKFGLQRINK